MSQSLSVFDVTPYSQVMHGTRLTRLTANHALPVSEDLYLIFIDAMPITVKTGDECG
jgi:hypothetical protein